MTDLQGNLDIELLQGRWVLGGIEPGQLVQVALSALEHGFDGPHCGSWQGYHSARLSTWARYQQELSQR